MSTYLFKINLNFWLNNISTKLLSVVNKCTQHIYVLLENIKIIAALNADTTAYCRYYVDVLVLLYTFHILI